MPCLTNAYKWLQRIVHFDSDEYMSENKSQFALSPSGKATDFDSVIRWFESNKGSSAYFLLTVYLCNQDGPPFNIYLFGFVQLRVVQDYPRGFASHRGVKFNLSRIFLNTPYYLLQNSW